MFWRVLQPWYARLSETELASNISRPGPATHLPQGQMLPPSGTSAAAASNSALPALPNGQQSHNEKKVHKQKHKHKHRHKETKSPSRGVSKCSKSKASLLQGVAKEQVLAAMREERANREASERGRQAELVRREAPAAKPSVPRCAAFSSCMCMAWHLCQIAGLEVLAGMVRCSSLWLRGRPSVRVLSSACP